MNLGEAIKVIRQARGWDQGRLATESGISQSHLSKIERGAIDSPGCQMVADIAKALNISTDYLFEEAGWLPRPRKLAQLSPTERHLIQTIRSTPTANIRAKLLEQLTWVAEVARDADTARHGQPLRLAAEHKESYDDRG